MTGRKLQFGNEFWKARSTHGRKLMWDSAEQLGDACEQYFQWVKENPLQEAIVYQGQLNEDQSKPLLRAMTIGGLCIFLGMAQETWFQYRKKEGFSVVVANTEAIIRDQKFSGAAAGLLNSNIIARDLGLRDTVTNEHSGPNGGPIQTSDMSENEIARRIAFALNAAVDPKDDNKE